MGETTALKQWNVLPTELNKNIENLTNEIKSRKEIEIQVEKEHKRQLTDLKK